MKPDPIGDARVLLKCWDGLIRNQRQAGIDSPCHKKIKATIKALKARTGGRKPKKKRTL